MLPQTLICNSSNSDFCWNNIFKSCKDALLFKGLYNLNDHDHDKPAEWYQWEKVPRPNTKDYVEKTLKKGKASVHVQCCHRFFCIVLSSKNKQMLRKIIKCKSKNDSELPVLQIDFAENFSTLWQDEGQSIYWNRRQITIFASVM